MTHIWELYENLDGYSYATNLETDELVYMNKKLRELLGIESLACIKGKCYEVLSGESQRCSFCNNARLKVGEYEHWETVNEHLDKVVSMSDTVVVEDGVKYRLSFGLDQTAARKKEAEIEENIRVQQEREYDKTLEINDYKGILDSMRSTGIYVITEDEHRVLYYNERVRQIAPNISEGAICHEIWSGTCDNCPLLTMGDRVTQTAINYDDPFGEVVDITASKTLWKNKIPAYIVQVSPHIESETEHNSKIRGIYVETMQDVFFRSGLVDMQTGKYESYNIAENRVIEETLPEDYDVLIRGQSRYVSSEYREEYQEKCSLQSLTDYFLQGNKSFEYVYAAEHIGEVKWVRFVARLCRKRGSEDHTQMIVMLEDFTKQKEVELENARELKDALRSAEVANRAKSDFLSRMSHDLRTPMNGIMGLSDIVYDCLDHTDTEVVKRYLKSIKLAGKQLESIINDVLDMSRLETGKMQLQQETFDLIEKIREIAPGVQMLAREKTVQLTGAHVDLRHKMVISSPMHIQRILTNIASNAVKYNRPNGTIEVWFTEEVLDHNHSNYKFVIKDSGIGMSEEFQTKIFEPFTREHSEAEYQGTGLGMTITKEIISLMNGTIEVESKQNVGTTVVINLPMRFVNEEDCGELSTENESHSGMEGLRILLVEDNDMNLEIAKYILEENGAIVVSARNGREAVDTFEQSMDDSFDLIIMDLMMPVMGGLEATKLIRKSNKDVAKSIPIIAMTANAFAEDIAKCFEAGMNGHIAKPIDIHKVVGQIRAFIP